MVLFLSSQLIIAGGFRARHFIGAVLVAAVASATFYAVLRERSALDVSLALLASLSLGAGLVGAIVGAILTEIIPPVTGAGIAATLSLASMPILTLTPMAFRVIFLGFSVAVGALAGVIWRKEIMVIISSMFGSYVMLSCFARLFLQRDFLPILLGVLRGPIAPIGLGRNFNSLVMVIVGFAVAILGCLFQFLVTARDPKPKRRPPPQRPSPQTEFPLLPLSSSGNRFTESESNSDEGMNEVTAVAESLLATEEEAVEDHQDDLETPTPSSSK